MALLLDKNEHERPFGKRLPMQWQELVSLMMFVERERLRLEPRERNDKSRMIGEEVSWNSDRIAYQSSIFLNAAMLGLSSDP